MIVRHCLHLVFTVFFGVVLFGLAETSVVAKSGRPNVLFILIDDMGWKDIGCSGSTFYKTPHIDKLAARLDSSLRDMNAEMPIENPDYEQGGGKHLKSTLGMAQKERRIFEKRRAK